MHDSHIPTIKPSSISLFYTIVLSRSFSFLTSGDQYCMYFNRGNYLKKNNNKLTVSCAVACTITISMLFICSFISFSHQTLNGGK